MGNKEKYTMQNSMRSLLSSFYTGSGLSVGNKIFYPYFCYDDPNVKKKIECIKGMMSLFEDSKEKQNFLNKLSSGEKDLSSKDIAAVLSSYFSFISFFKKEMKWEKKTLQVAEIDISAYPKEDKEHIAVLKKLQEKGKKLHKEKKGLLLLFGSLATRDYVRGHSDLDTVFIISKEACLNPEMLLEIRKDIAEILRESYFIDSLQHHGPYIFTEYDLEMFPQYYLPFAVWRRMVSLCGNVTVTLYWRETTKEEIVGELKRYKEMFLKILETPLEKLPKSNYSRKYLYQAILLFPAVYLLAKEKPCHKKDSFVFIREYLTDHGNKLLDELSDIWKQNAFKTSVAPIFLQKMFRYIPYPFLYPSLYRISFSNTLAAEKQREVESFLKGGAKEFIELIDEELKKYGNKKSI